MESARRPMMSWIDIAASMTELRAAREKAIEQDAIDGLVPHCDRCNKPMARRIQRATGTSFSGCSGFPKCRTGKSIDVISASYSTSRFRRGEWRSSVFGRIAEVCTSREVQVGAEIDYASREENAGTLQ
jgi:ssDNA-binding Zn-finger/Zn-ribbon topoisomerase 1